MAGAETRLELFVQVVKREMRLKLRKMRLKLRSFSEKALRNFRSERKKTGF